MKEVNFDRMFSDVSILCVGDVMLDHFYSGEAIRISPEAPVPILKVQDRTSMPGGAANTAMNVASLGAKVNLVAPVGQDEAGSDLMNILGQKVEITLNCPVDPRGTIVKSRYSAQGQQLLRIDSEDTSDLTEETSQAILKSSLENAACCQLIILSDYAKGVLNTTICKGLIDWARSQGVLCVVDPKGTDYSKYEGATIITPNEYELAAVSGRRASSDVELIADAMALIHKHAIEFVAVTRGKMGVTLIGTEGLIAHMPSFARDVFDVSGAGDSFVAGLSCALACGQSLIDAAEYGNAVAGVAVGKSGTALVSRHDVSKLYEERGWKDQAAVSRNYSELVSIMNEWREKGMTVGLTNGVFDLLHLGHLRILNESKRECDRLVVAINSDTSVKRLKGAARPIQNEEVRSNVLSRMQGVDFVFIFEEDTPQALIDVATPDVLIKGGDYVLEDIVGSREVIQRGGRVVIVPTLHGYSTTATVERAQIKDG